MERSELKRIVSSQVYNLQTNENFFIKSKIIEYLEKEIQKITTNFKYIRININNNKTTQSHYLSNEFEIYYYETEGSFNTNNYSRMISINIDEMFGNCSTVMMHNIEFDGEYFDNKYIEKLLVLFEDIIDLFGYTCIMFNLSSDHYENKKLMKILDENEDYKVIIEFKNKRGGYIKYYQKLI